LLLLLIFIIGYNVINNIEVRAINTVKSVKTAGTIHYS